MKFAIVDGERREAQLGLSGRCSGCGNALIPKCGKIRVHHWAHKGVQHCDSWQAKETEWHRNWKNQFPEDWQEVKHQNIANGELHFADIKTDAGWVIEFQYSPISLEEKKSREDFYPRLVWVVYGNRRSNDAKTFFKVLGNLNWKFESNKLNHEIMITLPKGSLFDEWVLSNNHVLFDFGNDSLWWLHPNSSKYIAYLAPISKLNFINLHQKSSGAEEKSFEDSINEYGQLLTRLNNLQGSKPFWTSISFEGHSEEVIKKLAWIKKKKG